MARKVLVAILVVAFIILILIPVITGLLMLPSQL